MPSILAVHEACRKRILAADQELAADLVKAYTAVYERLKRDFAAALADVKASPESVAYRVSRLRALEAQVVERIARYGGSAAESVTRAQAAAVELSAEGTAEQLTLALTPAPPSVRIESLFTRLPVRAAESLAGFASDGSPLAALFAEIAPAAGQAVRDRLLSGLALGFGPERLATEMRDELGVPLSRSLRIARTETLRAYRTSAAEYLKENSEYVAGWWWKASGGSRCCPVCWAMDGTFHPLDEPFASHVCCRCTTIPATKSWAEMGYPGMPDRTWKPKETGEEAFANLDESEQRKILGPGKYDLYRKGSIRLSDLVREGEDGRWGPYRVERSLKAFAG
ncbi:MAG TPA: phage minor head protein [Armatimonadota bacterium]|jgi:SPP1 gp7 family putative phage head morphogenesis protein